MFRWSSPFTRFSSDLAEPRGFTGPEETFVPPKKTRNPSFFIYRDNTPTLSLLEIRNVSGYYNTYN